MTSPQEDWPPPQPPADRWDAPRVRSDAARSVPSPGPEAGPEAPAGQTQAMPAVPSVPPQALPSPQAVPPQAAPPPVPPQAAPPPMPPQSVPQPQQGAPPWYTFDVGPAAQPTTPASPYAPPPAVAPYSAAPFSAPQSAPPYGPGPVEAVPPGWVPSYPPPVEAAPPPGPGGPSGRRMAIVGAAVVVVLALIVGGVLWLRPSDSNPSTHQAASVETAMSASAQAAASAQASVSAQASASTQTSASAQPSAPPPENDEFASGTVPDPRIWSVYTSTSPIGSKMLPSAVAVANGELQITGTGKNATGAGNVSGGICWCRGTGNKTSGVWTVRAKFDAGAGYGPSISLWPQSDNTNDGWITLVSAYQADRQQLSGAVWSSGGGSNHAGYSLTGDFTAWHVYSVTWRPNSVRISVDGKVLFDSATHSGLVIPTQPMHLVFQQAVGPRDGVPAANASTPDTVVMHVDWMRYQPL